MKILIVEDEALARERLKALLHEINHSYEIIDAENGLEALQKIQAFSPELVLLDIRMPAMDGLEVAHHLKKYQPETAIIFTTAYQDHAIRAFELNAIDYLLKPIRKSRLEEALSRSQIALKTAIDDVRLKDKNATRSHISVLDKGRLILIPVNEILYLKADDKYVMVVWSGGKQLLNEPLKILEQEFQQQLIRIHRNALIAKSKIASLQKQENGMATIKLRGIDDELQVSRRHLSQIRKLLKTLGSD